MLSVSMGSCFTFTMGILRVFPTEIETTPTIEGDIDR